MKPRCGIFKVWMIALVATFASLALATPSAAQGVATHIRTTMSPPATCSVGDVVVSTSGGARLSLCTTVNSWTAVSLPSGGLPLVDVRTYGASYRTFPQNIPVPTTTATTGKDSPTVLLPGGAIDFKSGEWIVIWKAGAATSQSTPSAPHVTSPAIAGSATIGYKCRGIDALGGLTADSATGSVTTAPAVFGSVPVAISSIRQSSGTVSVVLSAPMAPTPAAGMHVHIINVTGNGAGFNGVWQIASAADNQHFTYRLAGSAGSGTVSGRTTARLGNSVGITAISRSGATITATTDTAHGYQVQGGNGNTIVIITGVSPSDFNGEYVATAGTSGTTIVMANTAISATETGTVTAGSSIATVYPYINVTCPAMSGTTKQYYVLGDSGSGTFALIGKTMAGQKVFTDWGYWLRQGFQAPAYVPTTTIASAQNQMYVGKIQGGAGTTTLTVAPNVPTSVTAQTALHDDGQAILAAITARGTPLISVPIVINAPLTLPFQQNVMFNAPPQVNETVTWSGYSVGSALPLLPPSGPVAAFGHRSYLNVTGTASPMFNAVADGTVFEGLQFTDSYNGQTLVQFRGAAYSGVDRCAFSTAHSTSFPIVYMGGATSDFFKDTNILAPFDQLPQANQAGQMAFGPALPSIWIRADDSLAEANMPAAFQMSGTNSFYSRGILLDFTLEGNGDTSRYIFDVYEDQQPNTPGVMMTGLNVGNTIDISHFIMDSSSQAVVANWIRNGAGGTTIKNVNTSAGATVVTGFVIPGLQARNIGSFGLGQNYSFVLQGDGVTYQGQEILLGPGAPIIYPHALPTPTARLAGAGTVSAGTHSYGVSAVGWNGASTGVSPWSAPLTTDGAHGVTVSWTAVPGVQSYMVWNDFGGSQTGITDTSYTFSSNLGCCQATPTVPATGVVSFDPTLIVAPLMRLTDGALHKGDFQVPQPLTANRSYKLSDGDGSVVISATLNTTSATSDKVAIQGATSNSHCTVTPTNASAATNIATTYVSAKTANQITVTHTATANMNYDVTCTVN